MSKNTKFGMKIGYENNRNFESNIISSYESHKISLGSNFEVKCDG
jgi:hypothetical protein